MRDFLSKPGSLGSEPIIFLTKDVIKTWGETSSKSLPALLGCPRKLVDG